jgi:hypothetical protein
LDCLSKKQSAFAGDKYIMLMAVRRPLLIAAA